MRPLCFFLSLSCVLKRILYCALICVLCILCGVCVGYVVALVCMFGDVFSVESMREEETRSGCIIMRVTPPCFSKIVHVTDQTRLD